MQKLKKIISYIIGVALEKEHDWLYTAPKQIGVIRDYQTGEERPDFSETKICTTCGECVEFIRRKK